MTYVPPSYRSVVTVIFAIVLTIIRISCHINFIKYTAKKLAPCHLKLFLRLSCKLIAYITCSDYKNSAITYFRNNSSIDNTSYWWCINNNDVKCSSCFFYHLDKSVVTDKLTWVRWYRSCKYHAEIRNITYAYNILKFILS